MSWNETGCGAGDEVRTRDLQLGRLSLYQLSYSRMVKQEGRLPGGERRIRTSEGFPTELQSVPFGHSGISPSPSPLPDSNQRPTDYKSVALPAELRRHSKLKRTTFGPALWTARRTPAKGVLSKGMQRYAKTSPNSPIPKKYSPQTGGSWSPPYALGVLAFGVCFSVDFLELFNRLMSVNLGCRQISMTQ